MNCEPKVSVVIPVYNAERYLGECLESVLSQTLEEIEIICVDDGSTDRSLEILRGFEARDKRIVVISQKNAGAGAARNAGLRVAKGEHLSFLDSDDYFEPEMLKEAYAACVEKDADICVFRCDVFDDETRQFSPFEWAFKRAYIPATEPFSHRDFKDYIFTTFVGWTWDKLFRRAFIVENGLSFQNLKNTNDLFFVFTALTQAEHIVTLDRVFAHQRKRASGSLSVSRENSWDCFLTALDGLEDFLRQKGKYGELERGFINYALHFSLWNLNTLSGSSYRKLYNTIKGERFAKWGIGDRPEGFFYVKEEYEQYLRIAALPFELYVAGKKAKACFRKMMEMPKRTMSLFAAKR